MAATKSSAVPGEADKLIAHQARLLKAPRIAEHYHRLAEQGREANWSLEYYLAAVLTVESNARRCLPATAPVSVMTSRTTSKIRCGRSLAASRRRQ